jgi:single-stranded DNA-binding protein
VITTIAVGFIAEKPEVVILGAKGARKCEFDVIWGRRALKNNEWVTVWERATFVAWNDEAEKVAERLEKGSNVTCTGTQETDSWVPQGGGSKQYRVKYALTSWIKYPKQQPPSKDGQGQQRGMPAERGGYQQRAQPARPAPASRPPRERDSGGETGFGEDPFTGPGADDAAQSLGGDNPGSTRGKPSYIEM